MEAYPDDYVAQNRPLVVLSGLGPESSLAESEDRLSQSALMHGSISQLMSEVPVVTTQIALDLRQQFHEANLVDASVHLNSGRKKGDSIGFTFKFTGRNYDFPPRKADPPPESPLSSPDTESSQSWQSKRAPVLHSPISPLSPASPIFPDGVMTPLWVTKYQFILPSAFVSFFTLTYDPNLSSLEDNQVKSEIRAIKKTFSSLPYKTRCVFVLLGGGHNPEPPDVEDRISNIRRATGLDAKGSLFFVPEHASTVDLRDFVRTLMTSLRPACVEYYRELSKHARRKRNRGTVPPPTAPPISGTSRTLLTQGWNVRYEFKMGVFAEFRQELDAACRNYEGAYDGLLSLDVFETINSWSPRWDETRMLSDVITIRIIRCLLWASQTTSAVRRWQEHRRRIQDLLDRRGKGTNQYGWKAWESRWARIMAQLVSASGLHSPMSEDESRAIGYAVPIVFLPPEKVIPLGERLPPWEMLHHPGYWLKLSTAKLYERELLAKTIPEEDRSSPGQSPASQVASKSNTYDLYLCPEPHIEVPLPGHTGVDHHQLIIDSIEMTMPEFQDHHQPRAVEALTFEIAKQEMARQNWKGALHLLRPLWRDMRWRKEGWWRMVEDVGQALRIAASKTGDAGSVVSVEWESLSSVFTSASGPAVGLAQCLTHMDDFTSKPAIILRAGEVVSPLTSTYTFRYTEGHVGEPLSSQLVIESHAHKDSLPVCLSSVQVAYEGGLRSTTLHHSDSIDTAAEKHAPIHFSSIVLREPTSVEAPASASSPAFSTSQMLSGEANLTFAPGDVKVFDCAAVLREAGITKALSVTLSMVEEHFELDFVQGISDAVNHRDWWFKQGDNIKKATVSREQAFSVKVLPKPPKLNLRAVDLQDQFYTDEVVMIKIELNNGEDDEADVSLEVRVLGHSPEPPQATWLDAPKSSLDGTSSSTTEDGLESPDELPGHRVGKLAAKATKQQAFTFAAGLTPLIYVVEIKALYHLVSDMSMPLSKTFTVEVPVIRPFEANYDFSPLIHPAPWPNFFHVEETSPEQSEARGIVQKWCLTARLSSYATQSLAIEAIEIPLLGVNGGVTCAVDPERGDRGRAMRIAPNTVEEQAFVLEVRKLALEDRRSAALDLALVVKWRRTSDSDLCTTTLAVPRLLVPGGEPRVLASATRSTTVPGLIHLEYMLENPSMHLLTWTINMEISDDFVFSGPKLSSLQLVPFSRHVVRFNLLPAVRGTWIQPRLRVMDRYYNKTLKVSATEGMKMDKKGILIWVDADG